MIYGEDDGLRTCKTCGGREGFAMQSHSAAECSAFSLRRIADSLEDIEKFWRLSEIERVARTARVRP
jgi:hypothetical protein